VELGPLVYVHNVACRLRRPERTVRHWAKKGCIRARRRGRLWRFDHLDVEPLEPPTGRGRGGDPSRPLSAVRIELKDGRVVTVEPAAGKMALSRVVEARGIPWR
jgi:hypothetical protein